MGFGFDKRLFMLARSFAGTTLFRMSAVRPFPKIFADSLVGDCGNEGGPAEKASLLIRSCDVCREYTNRPSVEYPKRCSTALRVTLAI